MSIVKKNYYDIGDIDNWSTFSKKIFTTLDDWLLKDYFLINEQWDAIPLSLDVLQKFTSVLLSQITNGSFDYIDQYRKYRDTEYKNILTKNIRLRHRSNQGGVLHTRKDLIDHLISLLNKHDILDNLLEKFFGIELVYADLKTHLEKDDRYFYKWISIEYLFIRQLVGENYKYYDEPCDYFTDNPWEAYNYVYGYSSKQRFDKKWYMLLINKEKLLSFLWSLKDIKDVRYDELSYQINVHQDYSYYLYHIIVPLSCVDKIIVFDPWTS